MSDKNPLIQADRGQLATEIQLVDKDSFETWLAGLSAAQRAVVAAQRFEGKGYQHAIVPAASGDPEGWSAVAGVADTASLSSWCMSKLGEVLPPGTYRRRGGEPGKALHGWVTGQYRFDRYKPESKPAEPRILLTGDARTIEPALAEAAAVCKVRDLVNTPAEDLGPDALEAEARGLAERHKAHVSVVGGDALERGYPLIHAVGRAATRRHAPRLIELTWGAADAPRLALVGKGVCFDSGGLDIKPASGMALMKKDMGGAAHALALAGLIMDAGLKVKLHLLVPAVENAIGNSAFRPGDILASRAGPMVEVTNTDAEGRLILADALARAGEGEEGSRPGLVLDFATLTGAARVALGPDLPALMARDDATADGLIAAGEEHDDPLWRLPLHEAYREYLKSDVADLVNAPANGFAGASVAGLFLDRFVPEGVDWAHLDTFAWRLAAKPGRPKGGEALGLRAAWHYLKRRYS